MAKWADMAWQPVNSPGDVSFGLVGFADEGLVPSGGIPENDFVIAARVGRDDESRLRTTRRRAG